MLQKGELARLTWDGIPGAVVLGSDWRFRPVPDPATDEASQAALEMMAASADVHTVDPYSPADGQPGAKLASEVGARLQAHVELPPPMPSQPGVVY